MTELSLNKAQKKAVLTIENPVSVIAGPGTGKTQMLAHRVKYLLKTVDCKPEDILCLTYTDAGVMAMKKRLQTMIGMDAYRVSVHTFHSFCNQVIEENEACFNFKKNLPASPLDKFELIDRLMASWSPNHPLIGKGGDGMVGRKLLNLFQVMKKENWTAEFLKNKIEDFLSRMPDMEEYQYKRTPGKLKKNYKQDTLKFNKLLAAIEQYPDFQEQMNTSGIYDFEDMLLEVFKVFENKDYSDILMDYQERYLYLLVDEFQDTSGLQYQILQCLLSYWKEKPNVFIVGDNHQSIYRFQGASIENFKNFHSTYAQYLSVIVLEENYRSNQIILDASKAMIDTYKEDMPESLQLAVKGLKAQKSSKQGEGEGVFLRTYANENEQYLHIVQAIKSKIKQGVLAQEIAIIYSKHKVGEAISPYFDLAGIPYQLKKEKNALSMDVGKKFIMLLEYIADEMLSPLSMKGEEKLQSILFFDFWQIPPLHIAKHLVALKKYNYKKKPKLSLRESLDKDAALFDPQALFTQENPLVKANKILEALIGQVHNQNFQVWCTALLEKTGLFKHIFKQKNIKLAFDTFNSIFDFIKQENIKDQQFDIHKFLDKIKRLEKFDLSLAVSQYGDTQGVNLLTAHGAKGLEFEYVYIVDVIERQWEKQRPSPSQFSFPPILIEKINTDSLEEKARLFYVALTRAKKSVYISYPQYNKGAGKKENNPSQFFVTLKALPYCKKESPMVDESLLKAYYPTLLENVPSKEIKNWIDQSTVEKFCTQNLSMTQLNAFFYCPVSFYFQQILKIPMFQTAPMVFGKIIHTLFQSFNYRLKDEKKLYSFIQWKEELHFNMLSNKQYFDKDEYKRYQYRGEKVLEAYLKNYPQPPVAEKIEYPISQVDYKGFHLRGVLDSIVMTERHKTRIIDYKTGKNDAKHFSSPTPSNPYGGRYWTQAVFYQILVEQQNRHNWQNQAVDFVFVEPDNEGKQETRTIAVKQEDKQLLLGFIQEMYEALGNLKFNFCKNEHCQWCWLVKQRIQEA